MSYLSSEKNQQHCMKLWMIQLQCLSEASRLATKVMMLTEKPQAMPYVTSTANKFSVFIGVSTSCPSMLPGQWPILHVNVRQNWATSCDRVKGKKQCQIRLIHSGRPCLMHEEL